MAKKHVSEAQDCDELRISSKPYILLFRTHPSIARVRPSMWYMWFFNLCFLERKIRLLPHFTAELPSPREDSAWGHTTRKWESRDSEPGRAGLLRINAFVLTWNKFPGEPSGSVASQALRHTPPLHRGWRSPGLRPLLRVTHQIWRYFSAHLVYSFIS